MADIAVLAMRGLAGGTLVVVFALVGEVVSPKAFSGLFSAAPSVALASLTLTVMLEGTGKARQDSVGMVIGAVGMRACCVVALCAIPCLKALWGSVAAWVVWTGTALGLYWAVFVCLH